MDPNRFPYEADENSRQRATFEEYADACEEAIQTSIEDVRVLLSDFDIAY